MGTAPPVGIRQRYDRLSKRLLRGFRIGYDVAPWGSQDRHVRSTALRCLELPCVVRRQMRRTGLMLGIDGATRCTGYLLCTSRGRGAQRHIPQVLY